MCVLVGGRGRGQQSWSKILEYSGGHVRVVWSEISVCVCIYVCKVSVVWYGLRLVCMCVR